MQMIDKNKKASKSFFKGNGRDYLRTFMTTALIVGVFGLLNIAFMVYSIFNENATVPKKSNIDSAFESYLVDILIEKNFEFSQMYPKNYAVNMRLGILYGYKQDYLNAERELKNAVEKAVDYDYAPSFQLAKLYIKMNRLKDAQSVMDRIGEKPNKKLIRYKLHIYTLLGEVYYKQGYYALSMMKYEKAIQYYDVFKIKKFNYIFADYVKSCISLADWSVSQNKIDEAVIALEKAYKIEPENVMINYKLGLLNVENNPYKAYNYFNFVNKKNPQVLNYELYFDLINELARIEDSKGNYTQGELYRKKALQYQKFVKNNLLFDKDLFIDVIRVDIHPDFAAQEYLMNVQFRLQNNSGLDIDNLSVKVIFKIGNKQIKEFSQKIFDETRIFKVGTITAPIVISASESYLDKNLRKSDVSVEVYAYKYPKYEIKLYSQSFQAPPISP